MRRRARSLALQALYEIDSSDHPPGVVLVERLAEEPLPPDGEAFARKLVVGVLRHRRALDELISRYAPEWPLEQMALIDRNVLRMAIFEFAIDRDTPVKVAINEAVELGRLFGSDSAPRFINGVLGTLASQQHALAGFLASRPPPEEQLEPAPAAEPHAADNPSAGEQPDGERPADEPPADGDTGEPGEPGEPDEAGA